MDYNVIKKDKAASNATKNKSSRSRKLFNRALLATGITLGVAFAAQGQDTTQIQTQLQKLLYSYTTWDTSFSKLVAWMYGDLEGKDFSKLEFVTHAHIEIPNNPVNPIVLDEKSVKMTLTIADQKRLKRLKSLSKDGYCIIPAGECVSLYIYKEE